MKFARNERGFTLIELMVVVIIIGVLAAVIMPTVIKQADKAKVKRAISELKSIKTTIDSYYVENGSYPKIDEIMEVLSDAGFPSQLNDPWNQPYVYSVAEPPNSYKVVSYGPDQNSEGADNIYISDTKDPTEKASDSEVAD